MGRVVAVGDAVGENCGMQKEPHSTKVGIVGGILLFIFGVSVVVFVDTHSWWAALTAAVALFLAFADFEKRRGR